MTPPVARAADPPPPWGEPPPPPPARLDPLVGLYGRRARRLNVFEAGGALFAEGCGFAGEPLDPLRAGVAAARRAASPGEPAPVELRLGLGTSAPFAQLGGERLDRRDFDAEAKMVLPTIPATRAGEAAAAPVEAGPHRPDDLVPILEIDPGLQLDIRYATPANFMGFALYDRPAAFLQRPAAEALARVHRAVRAQGYGLIVHDAYRPWSVTRLFWDALPDPFRAFVADPAVGSRHNRGCAVDLTLCDRASGRVVEMPSRYDEASERSRADFIGGTGRQRWFRDRLRDAMEAEGFAVQAEEWWHFDFADWREYRVSDFAFADLERGGGRGR